jgi:TonB family protein
MSNRAKLWDVQPEAVRNNVDTSQKNQSSLTLVGGGLKAPRFRYELSPRKWDRLATSLVIHAVAIVILLNIAAWMPKPHIQQVTRNNVTPIIAPRLTPPPTPKPRVVQPPPQVLAKIAPPPKPTITVPPPKAEPPKVEPPKVEPPKVEPPKVEVAKVFPEQETPKPVQPKKEVVVNTFDSGSSAAATLKEPARKVQTGGFGDPNGVKGTSDKKAAVTVASLGSFDLPSGGGNGNGTGGTHGKAGTVASSGFGDETAGRGGPGGPKGTVQSAGFNAPTAATGPRSHGDAKPDVTPVEITFKPRPVYTDEARKLKVEGEVLLEVMFTASGELKVQRVVRGLGHGLDEAAQRAAAQIRFKPAKRDGQPYDSTALVHINFELAE